MAQSTDLKEQNQAFLKEMERQRLNKPCNRVIDLRGKVSSECQAYKIGDRTHYLDDRAYLIIKQLLARFNGRYTVGVYETVLKAIARLEQSTQTAPSNQPSDNHDRIPFIDIDYQIQRREQRVVYTTAVRIRVNDMLYHGHTLDIAVSALRVSMKRTHTLDAGDEVSVELVDEFEREGHAFLQSLSYIIRKIDHDDRNTTVILGRVDNLRQAENQWLQNWVQQHSRHSTLDIDNQIQNQLSDCYLQLWLKRMSTTLLWLQATDQHYAIKKCHLSRLAAQLFTQLSHIDPAILESLALTLIEGDKTDCLMVVTPTQSWACKLGDSQQVGQLIQLHHQQSGSEVLLLKSVAVSANIEADNQLIANIRTININTASLITETINRLGQRLCLYKITHLCDYLIPTVTQTADLSVYETHRQSPSSDLPFPTPLSTQVERLAERFYIHTPVTVYIGNDRLKIQTDDVSSNGLALCVPDYVEVKLNQQIYVDFTRWQEMSPNITLKQIPYLVKNKIIWAGQHHLGLQRIKHNRLIKLDKFFEQVIDSNRANLRENKQDVIDANENLLYLDLLKPTIESIPVFLGLDESGKRRIQMIAKTKANHAESLPAQFWVALDNLVVKLSERIRALNQNDSQCDHTAIYAYQDSHGQWQLTLEESLQNPQQKSTLLQRLTSANDYRVFHCQLIAIPPLSKTAEKALDDIFLQWRSKRAAKVKQIRQQLNQLFGLVELTDVSNLFEQLYQR